MLEDEVGHEEGAADDVDDPEDPQLGHGEVGEDIHHGIDVALAAVDDLHLRQLASRDVSGGETARTVGVGNLDDHPLVPFAAFENSYLTYASLHHFGPGRCAAPRGPDAHQVDDEDGHQAEDEDEDHEVLDPHSGGAAQDPGLLVEEVPLLPRLLDEPELVRQLLPGGVQLGDLGLGLVEAQLVLAVPHAQGDRLRLGRHLVELGLHFGHLAVDAADLLLHHVLHAGDAFEGAGFQPS